MLCAVGVSNEPLERLVYAARRAGALGAKLTRACGGRCMIALSESDKLEGVVDAFERVGGRAFVARKADVGVRVK